MTECKMTIRTNNVPRELIYLWQLTDTELKEISGCDTEEGILQFLQDNDGLSFFRYRGELYRLDNFVRIHKYGEAGGHFATYVEHDSPIAKWEGIATDSFFSGMLVKKLTSESVVVGRYYS